MNGMLKLSLKFINLRCLCIYIYSTIFTMNKIPSTLFTVKSLCIKFYNKVQSSHHPIKTVLKISYGCIQLNIELFIL